jgi:hypothetical protein
MTISKTQSSHMLGPKQKTASAPNADDRILLTLVESAKKRVVMSARETVSNQFHVGDPGHA